MNLKKLRKKMCQLLIICVLRIGWSISRRYIFSDMRQYFPEGEIGMLIWFQEIQGLLNTYC